MLHQLFFCKSALIIYTSITLIVFKYNVNMLELPCDKSRQVFNSSWGVITDGPPDQNYTQDSHCEWLIKAKNKEDYITLTFESISTECSYDYVFVYDGDTLKSRLLGSFSGRNKPQQVTAKSGAMLILLYSDANYVLKGFRAEFSVSKCPRNCSNHGECIGNKCVCNYNWGGSDCSFEIFPDNCGEMFGRGFPTGRKCLCTDGYSGQACDLNKYDLTGNSWHWLSTSENGLPERAVHTAVYIKELDSLYVFGGYNLNHVLGDLCVYNFITSSWQDQYGNPLDKFSKVFNHLTTMQGMQKILDISLSQTPGGKPKDFVENVISSNSENSTEKSESRRHHRDLNNISHPRESVHNDFDYPQMKMLDENFESLKEYKVVQNEQPSPRYGHAACRYPGGFVIYGGKTSNGSLSNELWFYNVTSGKWSLRAVHSNLVPPGLTRHTLTLVGNDSLYLFGGSTIGGEFSSKMYSIKLNSGVDKEKWSYIRPRGGKEFDVRLVGHSTVYVTKMHSLIIYGGIMAGLARHSKLSDRMFLFKISSRYWSEIQYPRNHISEMHIPKERAFHTSVILGNYMVVFGGYSHRHNKEEICYDNQMYIYHLDCHTWVSRDVLGFNNKTFYRHERQGVFAHAADVRNGNTLLVLGGYHGNVNADFWAYVFPPTLSVKEGNSFDPEQICSRHRTLHECTSNPECGWCPADEICYGRTVGINCTTNLQTTRCPGLCPSLGDCQSCLIHGETTSSNFVSHSVPQKLKLSQCIWCVQNAKCHHKDDNYGVCGLREDTPLQIPSWWGVNGTEIVSIEECRVKDRRPGLTFIKYKKPTNWSQPDAVGIVNATSIDFDVSVRDTKPDIFMARGNWVTRLLGFLWIPSEWTNTSETLKMCTSFSNAVLRLGVNNFNSLELVSNISAEALICKTAFWRSGLPVTLSPGRYLIDFESEKSFSSGSNSYQPTKMVIMHNKSQEISKTFTFEFLEPYKNGSCSSYSNCLQCLTDSLCGWCDISQTCFSRNVSESQVCTYGGEDWRYLTLQPSACINCSNYISCELCTSNSLCEWWTDEAKCSRRGRASFSIQTLSNCPTPCHLRKNCSQCLTEKGRCVWCEATQECFSFSVYTSEYQFGLCREWVDQNYSIMHPLSVLFGSGNVTFSGEQCKSCAKYLNCSTCLKTLSCGWCYDIKNPTVGVCVVGDFSKPENDICSFAVGRMHNRTLAAEESGWSYAQCPDVDECDLKLDDCHADAVCTNTLGSYTCLCKRGFYGDGHKSCTKTCYSNCIHGTCTMAPDYKCRCDLGWTGDDCSVDCGCNNHSTCNQRIGLCDQCQDWTTGEFCQYCKIGSYGNATSEQKCKKCECNGHEDSTLKFCDSKTGVCFCKDNTEGDKCERCKKGYYGNPKNGGICYSQCSARGIVTTLESKGIGSYKSSLKPWEVRLEGNIPRECLWILNSTLLTNSSLPSVIQLTINGDTTVNCQDNAVFVYEGLPNSVSTSNQNHALGTFCQRDDKNSLTVETKTGLLTVLYQQGGEYEGFNATYSVFTCPDQCPPNRICLQNECVCMDGWTGPNCTLPVCHNNCSFQNKQGDCNKGYGRCICKNGYGSSDCSVKINDYQIIFTELFNSAKISSEFDHLRKMIPRFGHSLVTDRRGSLWMFGGYSSSHGPLNDIRLFDTKNNTWMQVTVDSTRDVSMPQGRYFHAAEIVHARREIYIFGGIGIVFGRGHNTLQDLWKFSIKHQRWMDVDVEKGPPPAAGHTLTLMKDSESEYLFLMGGFGIQSGFLNRIWYFSLDTQQWNTLSTTGSGPQGIYGHSTTYHTPTKSFYVYGGYVKLGNRRTFSSQLYAFHYPSLHWSPLPTFEEYNPISASLPQSRFLHSAITTRDYMLVFGGRIFNQNRRNQFSDLLIAYSYSCNQWIRLLYKGAPVVGTFPPLTYAQAMAYDPDSRAVYIVGGFDNVVRSDVIRIHLPLDLCNLWQGKEKCRSFLGCSFCSVMRPDKSLRSFCYSSAKSLKESCDYYNGTLITNNGVLCDNKWFQQRSCENFRTCSECLAKWPTYFSEEPVCKWCSNCSKERCVPFNYTCRQDGKCENVIDVNYCSKPTCIGFECNKVNSSCSTETFESNSNSVSECVHRCSEFKNCSHCLSHQCRWSSALKECISAEFQPLFCTGSVCGLVLKEGNVDQCPKACSNYNQCATCLKNSHCGWCSVGNQTGEGVCTEGTLERPLADAELCQVLLNSKSAAWNYVSCPEENECTNGHHTCNPISEVCKDLPRGFRCDCNDGYRFSGVDCEPLCSQGCERGKCVQPDKCLCDFGYVGENCSIRCQCNGHSNCAGPDKLNECLECHNNTKGAQCERCKPLFVGDPTNNGKCIPCFEFCNRHTNLCINDSSKQLLANKSVSELISLLEEGPTRNALCVGCLNKTSGRRCDECLEGFFRGTEDLRHHCRPCECHGHGNLCNPVTGEECNCANNTENECPSTVSKNSNQQCWMSQCSKCKESYSGTPTEGHQCYKQMTLDHKFCLNSKMIEECKVKPKPLHPGQSAFFQVQPRYVNVDIRIFIDVMQGSLDLYMSLKDDSLVVFTNSSSGQHILEWDSKYKKKSGSDENFNAQSVYWKASQEKAQAYSGNWSTSEPLSDLFFGLEKDAEGLTTFITITKKNSFLHVKNIKGRLVITLPKDNFDLINTRFYLGLLACSEGDSVEPAYGIIFFRQDQLHIDLFVFFSVFFSCFFLFLAACVIAWKAKQAADIRRARRRHVVEMLHMAKRPFAKVIVHLETDDVENYTNPCTQTPSRWKKNKSSIAHGDVRPVAIEPTEDGLAAITTFFVKLPGGSDAPVQLSLASSLVTVSRNNHANNRVFLLRRSSHHMAT